MKSFHLKEDDMFPILWGKHHIYAANKTQHIRQAVTGNKYVPLALLRWGRDWFVLKGTSHCSQTYSPAVSEDSVEDNVWSLFRVLYLPSVAQTSFTVTVRRHRSVVGIKTFKHEANLSAQALQHAEKSHYTNQDAFQISLRLAPQLKQSEISIHRLFHFNPPSGYWSTHQVFIWVNFVPPHGGMYAARQPLILHEHVTGMTRLWRLYLAFFSFSFFFICFCRCLSRSVTPQISVTYTERG